MKRSNIYLSLILLLLLSLTVSGASVKYDAIMVRGDLPYDWTVAQAYSQLERIPIITTSPDVLNDDTRDQLMSFIETGHTSILVLGGEDAISPSIESVLVDRGFITHRIREVDRYGTAARVAIELYEESESVIVVNGETVGGLLNSQMAAFETGAPILFVKKDDVPNSVKEALRILGTKEIILIPSTWSEDTLDYFKSNFVVKTFPFEPSPDNGFSNLRILDIAIGLVLGAFLSLFFKRRRKEKIPYNILTEDEEKIIRAIENNGGELGQDSLYKSTGFSRPKISRVVSELVERDILDKTQFKRTFKLKIKKEMVKE